MKNPLVGGVIAAFLAGLPSTTTHYTRSKPVKRVKKPAEIKRNKAQKAQKNARKAQRKAR